jgi:putative hydrolase of the HAD superfamily
MRPEFVYFDLGNVLVNFSHRLAAEQIARVAGVDTELVWRVVFAGDLQRLLETGSIDSAEFCRRFSELTKAQCEPSHLIRAASDIFWLNSPIVPIVSQLAGTGIPLGILSNTCAAHWQHVCSRFAPLIERFPTVVLSYEVGWMKPDHRIYQHAVEVAGSPAKRILFVDDRLENVAGALAAGLDAHVFEDVPRFQRLLQEKQLVADLDATTPMLGNAP